MTLFQIMSVVTKSEWETVTVEVYNKTVANKELYHGNTKNLFRELMTYGSDWYKKGGKEVKYISALNYELLIVLEGRK